MKLDILAFGAHPDDVEMGCGGTIAKSTTNGKKVGIVDLTRGELGTNGTVEIREEEANVASKILGVSFRMNLELEDGFIFNNKEYDYKNLITRLKQINLTIVLLKKKYLDKL